LLGDPEPGESGFGTFSRAAIGGVDRYNKLREIERTRELQQDQLDLQKESLASNTAFREGRLRQGDERTDIARDNATTSRINAATSASRLAQADEQWAERLELLKRSVAAEETRASAAQAGSTGPERIIEANVSLSGTGSNKCVPA
jgi:hypothetical protein